MRRLGARYLFHDQPSYPRLLADLEGARSSIHLQFYIWRADGLGGRLADILFLYGEERAARRIARAVVAARPIDTTGRLAEVVARC